MQQKIVTIPVKAPLTLDVGEKKYTVDFGLPSVAKAEETLGRSLKTPMDWFGAKTSDIPVLLAAGLSKHHPEVTAEEVAAMVDGMGPEDGSEVIAALGALAFPNFVARYEANLEIAREKARSERRANDALDKHDQSVNDDLDELKK